MKLDIDSQNITLTCPGCQKEFDEQIGRLKNNPMLTCAGCGRSITINADELRQGIQSAEKALDDLVRSLRNIGK